MFLRCFAIFKAGYPRKGFFLNACFFELLLCSIFFALFLYSYQGDQRADIGTWVSGKNSFAPVFCVFKKETRWQDRKVNILHIQWVRRVSRRIPDFGRKFISANSSESIFTLHLYMAWSSVQNTITIYFLSTT